MTNPSPPNRASYPYIPLKSWFLLRKKFQTSLPKGEVTPTYLASLLGMTEDSAKKNVMLGLKDVGFLSDDNRLTDLAIDWRLDEQYKTICEKIIEAIYPHELTDLYPNPIASGEEGRVQDWFKKTTKLGDVAVRQATSFYALLAQGDLSKADGYKDTADRSKKNNGSNTESKGAKKPQEGANSKPNPETVKFPSEEPTASTVAHPAVSIPIKNSSASGMTLHIDLQIHISPESSEAQIDKIFSSIAKYIYDRD